jgi:hypothetical protein
MAPKFDPNESAWKARLAWAVHEPGLVCSMAFFNRLPFLHPQLLRSSSV